MNSEICINGEWFMDIRDYKDRTGKNQDRTCLQF